MSKLIEMIKRHEGVVPHAYQDSRGYWTIGVGRLIDKELGGGLSDDEVDYLLANDINRCIEEAQTYPWFAGLSEPRQAVVISLLFNLGKPRWDGFQKAQAAIAAGDMAEASRQLLDSKWARQVGQRAYEMAAQLESGEWK
jgi:lysozyme